ncbi:Integrator complex subunit 10 [Armadillidium vulgare]|nr:Integrator complex subunit 10 [Armadillidium vulgare]
MKITPDTELEHLKDEEYLIFRAKEEQVLNPFAAKSWLITAQIIYPQNFGIQFEIYKITKQEKNVRGSCKLFKHSISEFSE